MKEFVQTPPGSGGVEIALSYYQKPKQVYTDGSLYPELVPDCGDPARVLHVQRVEEVQIYFPHSLPNTVGFLSVPAHVILAVAAKINELQEKEEFLNMDE